MKRPNEYESLSGRVSETALDGITVIDLTHYIAGPFCTKLFADFGADVIKVEKPGEGDGARKLGPFPDDVPDSEASGTFLYLNTNKRGITLNLKTETGRKILKQLLRSADVMVENFRPGVMENLDLGWDTLSSINPELVMTSISNFGQTGPYRDYKASDLIHYGLAGFSYLNGKSDREPLKGPPAQSQYQAGMLGFIATMCAIMAREITGAGQHVDISILESVCSTLQPMILRAVASGNATPRGNPLRAHPSDFFECKDGHIYLYAPKEPEWTYLVTALGLDPELAQDPRFSNGFLRYENADEITELFRPRLMAENKETLFHELNDWGVIAGMALSTKDLFQSEHLNQRGFFVNIEHEHAGTLRYPGAPFRMGETPWRVRYPAPMLGQHNYEILHSRIGCTKSELLRLSEMSVI